MPPGLSTSAQSSYWLAQFCGWLVYAVVHYLSYLPALSPGEYLEYLGNFGLLATEVLYIPSGIAASTVLASVLRSCGVDWMYSSPVNTGLH